MFTNPEQNILRLGLKEGMRVADFGAGTGFSSRAASSRVGYTGKVFAVEVQKDLVKKVENDIKSWGISNIECIWGDIERRGGTKIADKSMDAVIVSNVLFQVEDKMGLIEEAKRVLKKDGKVLLVDWSVPFGETGPKEGHIINKERAKELFEKRGFKLEEIIPTSANHYGMIFKLE